MYITTREMVISIICNACGVLGLILWAIEARKANAIQYIQRLESVESVGNNDDIIVRSNLEPFRVDEPKDEPEVVMPKKCKGCDSASKIIEAYSRGFEDGAEAVKAMPQTEEWYTFQDEQEYNARHGKE